MKICKYCGIEKDDSEFEIANVIKGKAYRRLKCNKCYADMKQERRIKIRAWLKDYKAGKQCQRCGFDDSRALCFHHRDQKDKDGEISTWASNGTASIERIKKEIDKCDLICANCHHIEHQE